MTTPHPFEELLRHAHVEDAIPDAWIAAHGGAMQALWETCDDVDLMMGVAVLTAQPSALICGVCALVRPVVQHLPRERRDAATAALNTAEAWAHGRADIDALMEAAAATDHAYANAEPLVPLVSTAACAVHAAVAVAVTTAGEATNWYEPWARHDAAINAAVAAAAAVDWADPRGYHAGRPHDGSIAVPSNRSPALATVLRAHLPYPTLAAVRAGIASLRADDDE